MSQSMSIAVLPPDVAAKIAAGEVIERPSSIVRELIDNALDAGARRIQIEIEGGGAQLIRISDDGHGLAPEEMPAAFLRHATSKLRRPEDLASVSTLGFRGEALPSIAAAADVDFASRPEGTAPGALLRFSNGALLRETPYAGSRGTVVAVRDLFATQPARRKFLRTASAEAGNIATLVGVYAIAYPEVAFTLQTDGRRSLATAGNGDRREATARVYGADTGAALLDLATLADEGSEPGAMVDGLISPPGLTRANRSQIVCFVNRRIVQPRRLAFAVETAYESLLMSGRHPIAILDIRIPAGEVDVNVHPTKSEVRFLREREVHAAVYHKVRARLGELGSIPHSGGFFPSPFRPQAPQDPSAEGRPMPLWRAFTHVEEHDRPAAPAAKGIERPVLPILRVLGQAGALYIVAEGPDGMYLVDQHAAHERVLYEKVVAEREGRGIEIQGLLSPSAVELTPAEDAVLAGLGETLQTHGFQLEPFGTRTYLLRAIPAVLVSKDPGRALADLLDNLSDEADPVERKTRVAMTVACHAAVRAGKTMAMDEMRELLGLLERCELPRTCPHGRPTMIHLSNEALEREFHRR
jgi:DNA mismatch repair protein MutL